MTLSLLRAAKTDTMGQAVGSWATQYKPCLQWKNLVELYENKTILKERIQQLKTADLEDSDELIALAEEYLAGRQDEMT